MESTVFIASAGAAIALLYRYLLCPSPSPRGGYIVHSAVTHARLLPTPSAHAFTYPLLSLLLPLGALEAHALDLARGWLFGYGGLWGRVTGVRPHGYLADGAGSLRAKLLDVLAAHGHAPEQLGEVWMLTMPSYLGFEGINPLSVYFCERAGGELWLVVLEIHNTFGERHVHVLEAGTAEDAICSEGFNHQWTFAREFHVSPFNDRSGFYTIAISSPWRSRSPSIASNEPPLPRPVVRIHLHTANPISPAKPGALKLTAVLRTTHAEPLTSRNLLSALARQPFVLLLAMARIVYHAWILHYRRRLDVYVRPDPLPALRDWGGAVGTASGGVGWQREGGLERLARRRVEAFLARRAGETGLGITLVSADPAVPRRVFRPAGDGGDDLTIWYRSPQFFTTLVVAPSIAHALLVGSVAEDLFACSSEARLRAVFSPGPGSGEWPMSFAQRTRMKALPPALLSAPGYGVPGRHPLDSHKTWGGDAAYVWTLIGLGRVEEFVYGLLRARFVAGQEPWRRWERAAQTLDGTSGGTRDEQSPIGAPRRR